MQTIGWIATMASFTALAACGSDADGNDGTSPRLFDVGYSPQLIVVNESTQVSGQVRAIDPDQDIAEGHFLVTRPDGADPVYVAKAKDIIGAEDICTFNVPMTAFDPGTHTIDLWVIDSAGNESNRITMRIEAVRDL